MERVGEKAGETEEKGSARWYAHDKRGYGARGDGSVTDSTRDSMTRHGMTRDGITREGKDVDEVVQDRLDLQDSLQVHDRLEVQDRLEVVDMVETRQTIEQDVQVSCALTDAQVWSMMIDAQVC